MKIRHVLAVLIAGCLFVGPGCSKKVLAPPVQEAVAVRGDGPVEVVMDMGGTAESAGFPVFDAVLFDLDRAEIRQDGRGTVDQVAGAVAGRPGATVRLVGGCCPLGSDAHNDELGMRRALAVKQVLMWAGVPAGMISVESVGERDLVTKDPSKYWMNRRCEITIVEAKQ